MVAVRELSPIAQQLPPCAGCQHWRPAFGDYRRCDAFPEGIPDVIWLRFRRHIRPVAGDNGIRFEPFSAAPRED